MDPVGNTVSYCCVWKGGRVLYTYHHHHHHQHNQNGGERDIGSLAALCLEAAPPYHRWYFHTMGRNTFGFLMDGDYVYFAIVYESVGNSQVLGFLQKLRDEFRRVGKRGGTAARNTALNSLCLQEQLLPVVRQLAASLEKNIVQEWPHHHHASPSSNAINEVGAGTKAPLLGKPSTRQEKRKMKDRAVAIADIEMEEREEEEEHRRSTDRRVEISDSNHQGTSRISLNSKSTTQNLKKKWCRQVRIILAIDAAVCIVLFVIWLVICRGIECVR